MFTKILLTTDSSETAETAAPYAIELAKAFDARLQVIYVVETDPTSYAPNAESEEARRVRMGRFEDMTDVHERAAAAIDRIRTYTDDAGIEIEPVITVGTPVDEIVAFAESEAVDMIVMTSHGRSGIGRFLMGSVTEAVARNTNIPVLIADANAPPIDAVVSEPETV